MKAKNRFGLKAYHKRNTRLQSLGFKSYQDYLASDLWKSIRAEVLKRDGGKCQICGGAAVQVHHTCYSRASLTRMTDGQISICRSCHKFIEFEYEKKVGLAWVRKRVKLLKYGILKRG